MRLWGYFRQDKMFWGYSTQKRLGTTALYDKYRKKKEIQKKN